MIFKQISNEEFSKNGNTKYKAEKMQYSRGHWNDWEYIKEVLSEIEGIVISGKDFDTEMCLFITTLRKQNHRIEDVKVFSDKEDPSHKIIVFVSGTKNTYDTKPFETFMQLNMKKEHFNLTIFDLHKPDTEKKDFSYPERFVPNDEMDRKLWKYQCFV